MPPAFIQSKGGTSNTLSSLPVSFTSNNAAGNLLVCSGVVNASGIAGLTITDTQGNTWTIALVDNWKPLSTFFMAYTPNCKAGANTVTIAQLGSLISGAVSEYSGVSTTTPLDEVGFSDSGAGTWTSATSGNVTTRDNGELIVSAQGNSTGPASVTLGSGFSNLQNDSGNFVSLESQVQATAGAIAGTFTISASSGACGILTFVPSGDVILGGWAPQGTVIASASDSPQQPNVLYEGNAQILSGTVFKCIFSVGGGNGMGYAESSDGKNWTRYSGNPVLMVAGGIRFPKLFKNGSTYYLYVSPGAIPQTTVDCYTSTNLLTWTLAKSGAFTAGLSGAWDSTYIGQPGIFGPINGIFYAYYFGSADSGNTFKEGLATSTDLLNWTKSANNPIIIYENSSNFTFQQIGSVFYGWTQISLPDIPGGNAFGVPSDITRFSTTNPSGPWTPLGTSTLYRTNFVEGVICKGASQSEGQVADPSIVFDGTNTWMFVSAGNPVGPTSDVGIRAFKAPNTTIAQLVQTYEGVQNYPIPDGLNLQLVQKAQETFSGTRALGSEWTPFNTGVTNTIISGLATATTANTASGSFYNALGSIRAQYAQITIGAFNTSECNVGPCVMMQSGGVQAGYRAIWVPNSGSSGSWSLSVGTAGTFTTLTVPGGGSASALGSGFTVNVGDVLTLCAVPVAGTTYLSFYWNGVLVCTATDTTYSSGFPGMIIKPLSSSPSLQANAGVSAFAAGTFQDAPLVLASISGNAGVGGATITYSGASSGSVTADSFGNYLLSNLLTGSYTITPSLASYTFSPTSSNQILSGTNITGVNFVATQQSSTTAGPSSGLQSVQLYGRLANGSIVAVSVDINGNLAVSGGTGGAINSVDVLKNGVATPAMVYGVTSAGKLVAVAVDANGNLCCANVGAGGGNSSTTVDIAKYATPTPVQAVGREPISGKLYAVPLNASNSLYDSVHPGATPTSSLTIPGVAPRPVQLCGRAPNGKIIAVALDTSGRLCVSGSGQSGSANAVDAFKNGVPLAIQLFGINSAGKLQPVPLDANGNLELS